MNQKHHYIPQFYIKYWSSDSQKIYQHRLTVMNEKVSQWEKKSIKYVGFFSNLYTGG